MIPKLDILKKANEHLNIAISHMGEVAGDIARWGEYRKLVSCKIKLETIAAKIERDIYIQSRRERNKNNANNRTTKA